MNPIKLGRKVELGACCPCPVNPEDKVSFPCLYLNDLKVKIPDSGIITFRYEVSSRRERPKDSEVSVDLDMLQIVDIKADPKVEEKLSAAETLDKLAKEVVDEDDTPAEETKSSREAYVQDES